MPNPNTIELKDFGVKIKSFLIATQLVGTQLPEMKSFSDLAVFLDVKPARISEWVQGIPNKLRLPNYVPLDQANKLSEALSIQTKGVISIEDAKNLWISSPFLLFKSYLFGRPVSRIEEVITMIEPTLVLEPKILRARRHIVSYGQNKPVETTSIIPIDKDFCISSEEPINGWVILTASLKDKIQLLVPSSSFDSFRLNRSHLNFPDNPPYLRLNEKNEPYIFNLIVIDSITVPPILPITHKNLVLNENEQREIANLLVECDFKWGTMIVASK